MEKIYLVVIEMTNDYSDVGYLYKAFFLKEVADKYAEQMSSIFKDHQIKTQVKPIDFDTCIYNGEEGCVVADINISGLLNFTNKCTNELDSVKLNDIRTIIDLPQNTTIIYNDVDNYLPDDYVYATEDKNTLELRCKIVKDKLKEFMKKVEVEKTEIK